MRVIYSDCEFTCPLGRVLSTREIYLFVIFISIFIFAFVVFYIIGIVIGQPFQNIPGMLSTYICL